MGASSRSRGTCPRVTPSSTVGASRIVQQNPYLLRYVGLWDMLQIVFLNIFYAENSIYHLDNSHCFWGLKTSNSCMKINHHHVAYFICIERRQWTCSCSNVPQKPLLQFLFHFTFYIIIKIARTVVR